MYLQGKVLESLLSSLPRTTVLELREASAEAPQHRVPAGILYPSRALELLAAEQIGAIGSVNRIRYLLAKVPVSQFRKSAHAKERSAADLIAQDDRTVIRGHDIQALNYSHNFPINAVYGPFFRLITRPGHKTTSRELALALSLVPSL